MIILDVFNIHCFRNPTPDSILLPNWEETREFPVNYYRLGNFDFESKPMFGMENGGIFEDRTKFWRHLYGAKMLTFYQIKKVRIKCKKPTWN